MPGASEATSRACLINNPLDLLMVSKAYPKGMFDDPWKRAIIDGVEWTYFNVVKERGVTFDHQHACEAIRKYATPDDSDFRHACLRILGGYAKDCPEAPDEILVNLTGLFELYRLRLQEKYIHSADAGGKKVR